MWGAAAAYRAREARARALGSALAFAALAGLTEVGINVFGDGVSDLSRHLVLANFLVDLGIVFALWLAILWVASARRTAAQGGSPTRRIKSA